MNTVKPRRRELLRTDFEYEIGLMVMVVTNNTAVGEGRFLTVFSAWRVGSVPGHGRTFQGMRLKEMLSYHDESQMPRNQWLPDRNRGANG